MLRASLFLCVAVCGLTKPAQAQQSVQAAQLVHTIGEAFGPEEYAFGWLYDLAAIGHTVYALDAMTQEVRFFDDRGTYLGRFGGFGGGPGEFARAVALQNVSGRLQVYDMFGPNRIVTFDPHGNLITVEKSGYERTLGSLQELQGERFVARDGDHLVFGEDIDSLTYSIITFRRGSTEADTLARGRSGVAVWYEPGRKEFGGWTETDFGAAINYAADAEVLYISNGYEGWLRKYEVGESGELTLVTTIDLGLVGEPVTAADAARALRLKLEKQAIESPHLPRPRDPQIDAPAVWSGIRGLLLEPSGHLWVEEWGRREQPRAPIVWRRYTPDLTDYTRVIIPDGIEVRALGDGRLFGITTAELGYHTIAVLSFDPTH